MLMLQLHHYLRQRNPYCAYETMITNVYKAPVQANTTLDLSKGGGMTMMIHYEWHGVYMDNSSVMLVGTLDRNCPEWL